MTSKYGNDSVSSNCTSSSFPQEHYSEDNFLPAIKRRRRFTADETRVLEREYDINPSPNQQKIQAIANSISTPRKIVTTWFQNRRAKNKRKIKLMREGTQEAADEDIDEADPKCFTEESDEDNSQFDGGIHDHKQPDNSIHSTQVLPQQPFSPLPAAATNHFQEPYLFQYPYTNDTRLFEYQHDFINHHLLPSSVLESDNNTLYINPADIYLNFTQTSDTEQ